MDIVKAFQMVGVPKVDLNIQGTSDDPLFQANQIGTLLGLTNIRDAMKDFDEDEKVVSISDTLGGKQKTMFLTEVGLYRLLGMSRKPFARPFQKWVAKVVKEIRTTGKYELQKAMDQKDQNMKEKMLEIEAMVATTQLAIEEQKQIALEQTIQAHLAIEELNRLKNKTYEEVLKYEKVYINQSAAELHREVHKLGKSIDEKKRASQFNTAHPDGTLMLFTQDTSNAYLVEKVVAYALKKYNIGCNGGKEFYNNQL